MYPNNLNFKILWFESLLFSMIIGTALHSWAVAGMMFLGLWWLLSRRRGIIYVILALSVMWGILVGNLGYGLGGWAWAVAFGGLALMSGIKVHYRDLKRPFEGTDFEGFDIKQWRRNWYLGGQNLN